MTATNEEIAIALVVREWFAGFNRWLGVLATVRVMEQHVGSEQGAA